MNYKKEDGNIKIALVIAIVIAIILGLIFVFANKKSPKDINVAVYVQEPFEYFNLYSLDEKVGVLSKDGTVIINPEYSDIYIPNQSKDVFFCVSDENEDYKILDKTGKELYTEFANVSVIEINSSSLEMEKNVLKYEKEERFGLIDYEGNKLTEAIYEDVTSLQGKPGFILVRKDGLYGLLDSNGNIVIEPKYNSIKSDEYSSEKEGYQKTGYIVSVKTETGVVQGYIDYEGNILVEPKYEVISRAAVNDTEDIYLIYREKGKKGVIKNKKIIMKSSYKNINYYDTSKIFVVTKNGKYGFYKLDGNEILAPEFTSYSVAGNYLCVSQDEKMMLYDLHGNLVNANRYKSIIEAGNSPFFIAQDNSGFYSIISKDVEVADDYTNIVYAYDNFFVYTDKNGMSGILNAYTGTEVEAQYDYIIVLENAKAMEARKGDIVDIYSSKIEKILTMSGAVVEKVSDTCTAIYSENELKYINNNGELVANTDVFKDINLYSYQNEENKWGFKNKFGEIVINAIYDRVTELNEYGYAGIKLEGKWGVIDKEGNLIIEPSYEIESYYAPSFIGKYLVEESENIHCVEVNK